MILLYFSHANYKHDIGKFSTFSVVTKLTYYVYEIRHGLKSMRIRGRYSCVADSNTGGIRWP